MNNLKYFALMYLNDWYWQDKPFSERIFSGDEGDSLDAFNEAASYYAVTRNFPRDGKEKRLAAALNLVLSVQGPLNDQNVCEKVDSLAAAFNERYGKWAISAASKFLWLRFKRPVVIYDGRALGWLKTNGYRVSYGTGGYKEYRDQWLAAFNAHGDQIQDACSGLVNIKSYSLAYDQSSEEVASVVASRWFAERVFDKYLWFNGALQR